MLNVKTTSYTNKKSDSDLMVNLNKEMLSS